MLLFKRFPNSGTKNNMFVNGFNRETKNQLLPVILCNTCLIHANQSLRALAAKVELWTLKTQFQLHRLLNVQLLFSFFGGVSNIFISLIHITKYCYA